jgi:hypothetical protein
MSETPRTDTSAFDAQVGGPEVVDANFARTLECENNALRAELKDAIEFMEAAKSAAQPGHTGWFAIAIESARKTLSA